MSVMRVMSAAGDTAVLWDRTDEQSVANVRAEFNRLMAEGNLAFKVDPTDRTSDGELTREFDPNVEELLVSPALRGG